MKVLVLPGILLGGSRMKVTLLTVTKDNSHVGFLLLLTSNLALRY